MTDEEIVEQIKYIPLHQLDSCVLASVIKLKKELNKVNANISLFEIDDKGTLAFLIHNGEKPERKKIIKMAREAVYGNSYYGL